MFKSIYARTPEQLNQCFDRLERSAYYDGSLTRAEVVQAWEKIVTEGTGHLICAEYYEGKRAPVIYSNTFVVMITERYAARIICNPQIAYLGMDFLRCYHDYHFKKRAFRSNRSGGGDRKWRASLFACCNVPHRTCVLGFAAQGI